MPRHTNHTPISLEFGRERNTVAGIHTLGQGERLCFSVWVLCFFFFFQFVRVLSGSVGSGKESTDMGRTSLLFSVLHKSHIPGVTCGWLEL